MYSSTSHHTGRRCLFSVRPHMRPFIIPVFITHQGCPHRCIFCNQHSITGQPAQANGTAPSAVRKTIDEWLARPKKIPEAPVQVAFYGGSFTGLKKTLQARLLKAVQPYIQSGRVETIRLSTRPDYVDHDTPSFLRKHGVGCVELGVQSLSPDVLAACGREYSEICVKKAVGYLKSAGLLVGVQIMIGLPRETTSGLIESVQRIVALKPDFARIYPTLVIRGSGLHLLYANGQYKPLSMNQAIARTMRVKKIFSDHGIKVIRMGLQHTEVLEKEVVAGPYHPAFGELVLSRSSFTTLRKNLVQVPDGRVQGVSIAPADLSILRGFKNGNMKQLAVLGLLEKMEIILNPKQDRYTITIEDVTKNF